MHSHPLYPPLRPQSIGEVLDTGFDIFWATLLRCIPHGVLLVLVGQHAGLHELLSGRASRPFGVRAPLEWAWSAICVVLSVLLWASLILRQSALAGGGTASFACELRSALARLPQLIALTLLAILGSSLGLALLVLPALYLAVALPLAAPALLLRNAGPLEALVHSVRLIHGRWWRTAFILTTAAFVTLVLYIVAGAIVTALSVWVAGVTDAATVAAVSAAAGTVVGAIGLPFGCAVILATFGELEVRRRGLDLERRTIEATQHTLLRQPRQVG